MFHKGLWGRELHNKVNSKSIIFIFLLYISFLVLMKYLGQNLNISHFAACLLFFLLNDVILFTLLWLTKTPKRILIPFALYVIITSWFVHDINARAASNGLVNLFIIWFVILGGIIIRYFYFFSNLSKEEKAESLIFLGLLLFFLIGPFIFGYLFSVFQTGITGWLLLLLNWEKFPTNTTNIEGK